MILASAINFVLLFFKKQFAEISEYTCERKLCAVRYCKRNSWNWYWNNYCSWYTLRANVCKNRADFRMVEIVWKMNFLDFLVYKSYPGDNLLPKIIYAKRLNMIKIWPLLTRPLKSGKSFFCFVFELQCL